MIIGRLYFFPRAKSLGSWAGVIFKAPVPNSLSTYSSAIISISLPTRGSISFLPIKCLYLSSSGWTATATSASIVSGLEVAMIIYSSESFTGYFRCQRFPAFSACSTSSSARAVPHLGHQLTIYSPW